MPYSNVYINGAEAEKKDLFTTDISTNWKEIAKSSDSKEDEDNHLYTHIYAYVEDGDSSNQLKKLQKYSGSGEEYSTASILMKLHL